MVLARVTSLGEGDNESYYINKIVILNIFNLIKKIKLKGFDFLKSSE